MLILFKNDHPLKMNGVYQKQEKYLVFRSMLLFTYLHVCLQRQRSAFVDTCTVHPRNCKHTHTHTCSYTNKLF